MHLLQQPAIPGFAAGTYAVEVRDANSCVFSTSVTITSTSGPTAIVTTVVNAACGASNGSITLGAVTGGLAPYTYSVDGSAFTATTSYPGFAAGTYAVEVRDANGCVFSTTASVSNTSGPTAIASTIVNATCGGSNGSITLGAVTGGLAPYTYSVDGSAFTATTSYTWLCCRNICCRGKGCKWLYILNLRYRHKYQRSDCHSYNSCQCSMRSFKWFNNPWSCNRRTCSIYIFSRRKCIHCNYQLSQPCCRNICC